MLMHPTDAELVHEARLNNMSAFHQLVERYKKKVYYTAYGILGNHHDAEDVMQESMLQALRKLDKLRKPEGFGPWVARISRNKSIDIHRKTGRTFSSYNSEDGTELFDSMADKDAQKNPERRIASQQIQKTIARIIETLPESQRIAFQMKHLAHMTIKEISEATDSSESTVKTNIYRAVQKMRIELKQFIVP
jgi:RNA polymerase sigma-70 factor (ECF subfamily)